MQIFKRMEHSDWLINNRNACIRTNQMPQLMRNINIRPNTIEAFRMSSGQFLGSRERPLVSSFIDCFFFFMYSVYCERHFFFAPFGIYLH